MRSFSIDCKSQPTASRRSGLPLPRIAELYSALSRERMSTSEIRADTPTNTPRNATPPLSGELALLSWEIIPTSNHFIAAARRISSAKIAGVCLNDDPIFI